MDLLADLEGPANDGLASAALGCSDVGIQCPEGPLDLLDSLCGDDLEDEPQVHASPSVQSNPRSSKATVPNVMAEGSETLRWVIVMGHKPYIQSLSQRFIVCMIHFQIYNIIIIAISNNILYNCN